MTKQDGTDLKKLEMENRRLKALVDMSRALADSHSELSDKLDFCVSTLAGITEAEKASIMLVEGDELVVRAATGKCLLGMASKLSDQTISTQVVRSGEPFYARDLEQSGAAGLSRQGDRSSYRTGSVISLPLWEGGRAVGVLNLSDKAGHEFFAEEDLDLARDLAGQLSRQVYFSAMHSRLDQAFRDLKSAQRSKDDLMHLIFHDMKAPVTGAKEMLTLLAGQDDAGPEERDRLLGLAQSELELLWRRISNLLDLNRMDGGAYKPNPLPLDLGQMLREVLARLEVISRVNRVEVAFSAEDGPEAVLDEDLVERMMANLLANALRVSAPEEGGGGQVRVELSFLDGRALVSVIDSGPGVEPSLGQGVFERFTQGGKARGSSGLGLYFCRRAAWMMGGEVGFENLDKGGARFWLDLPVAGFTQE